MEEFYKCGIPFVVFDPIDIFWGLRLAANGKDKGLPIVVFGTERPGIPFTRSQLAIKSGKSYTSSSYLAAINRLVKLQLITKSGNDLTYQT